jgi:AraC-like DNA-binding protein
MTLALPQHVASTPLVVAIGYDRHRQHVALRRLAGVATVRFVHTADACDDGGSGVGPAAFLCRLDPTRIPEVLAAIQRAHEHYPYVPILVCSAASDRAAVAHILAAARIGPMQLVLDETDRLEDAVGEAVERASLTSVCAETALVVNARMPAPARPVLQFCIMNVRRALTVVDVAAAVGVHPRSLQRRLHRLGLPSPSSSISWSRLFVAVRLMNEWTRSVEQVALALRFSSGSALRNMLKRYSGLTPSELRRPEGLSRIAAIFQAADRV